MGKLALAAKITHVPSMYLSELPGKNHGCRQGAIDGHKEISKRCREMGVDTIIVFIPTGWSTVLITSTVQTILKASTPATSCRILSAI